MELSFRTRELRLLCENPSKAETRFDLAVSDYLRRRIADLHAATTIDDLVAGYPRFTDGTHGEMRIDIAGTHELLFRPNHQSLSRDSAGLVDWTRVHRIQIVEIEEVS
jgi:hypothetical protein